MLRALLGSLVIVVFCGAGIVTGDDQDVNNNNDKKEHKATITKVDDQNRTITVKMKDENGQDVTKTFKLAEDIRLLDSSGRVAAIDVFESGNEIIIIEREGKLREIHQKKKDNDRSK